MRIATVFLFAALPVAPALAATEPQAGEMTGPTLAFTPSGYGDPEAVVCRAPQKLENGEGMGPKICMHNRVWILLTQNATDLAADGKSVIRRPVVEEPHGNGPAEAVTCRKPATITASRTWRGPIVCLQNREWASLYEQHLTLTSDGRLASTRMNGPATDAMGMPMVQTAPPPRNAPVIGGFYSPL